MNFDMSPLADRIKLSGKPAVVWLIGKRELALEMQIAIQKLGIPVFREIQRSVECLRAVFKRNKRELPWLASETPRSTRDGLRLVEADSGNAVRHLG